MNHSAFALRLKLPDSDLWRARCGFFGAVWAVSTLHERTKDRSLSTLHRLYEPAFRHGQFAVYTNSMDEPVAFAVWAFLARDVEDRILENPAADIHLSEWTEGGRLWILDAVAKQGYGQQFICQLSDLFQDSEEVVYPRRLQSLTAFRLMDRTHWPRVRRLLDKG